MANPNFDQKFYDTCVNEIGKTCFSLFLKRKEELLIFDRNHMLGPQPIDYISTKMNNRFHNVILEIVKQYTLEQKKEILTKGISQDINIQNIQDELTMAHFISEPISNAISVSILETIYLTVFSQTLHKKYGRSLDIPKISMSGMKHGQTVIADFHKVIGISYFLNYPANNSKSISEIKILTNNGYELTRLGKILCPAGREPKLVTLKDFFKIFEYIYEAQLLPYLSKEFDSIHKKYLEEGNRQWQLLLGDFEIEIKNKKYLK